MIIFSTVICLCASVVSLPSASFVVAGVNSGSLISSVPNLIGTWLKRLYLFNKPPILLSSKKSKESSAICKIISVPLSALSLSTNVNSGEPSQVQCAAGASLKDFVINSTFSATINAE